MGSQLTPVPSPFVESPFQQRRKGFGERLVDEFSDLSIKQALGAPLTVPLQLGTGALKGLSFGLLDFNEELKEGLGEFALPDSATAATEIAGEIGGSFIPFVGASAVASRVFKGIDLASKLARGSFTFAAPEVVRQALTQEIDSQAVGRSVASGAAFALPLPRVALAPAVGLTELALGASPEEAAIAAGFAGLFGPLEGRLGRGRNQELPARAQPELPRGQQLNLPLEPPQGRGVQLPLPGLGGRPVRVSEPSPPGTAIPTAPDRQLSLFGPQQLSLPLKATIPTKPTQPKSQVELIREAGRRAPDEATKGSMSRIADTVNSLSRLPEEELGARMNRAIDLRGVDDPEARMMRLALAQKRRGFVPQDAPLQNVLPAPTKGIDLVQPGPTNPFEMRQNFQQVLSDLRANGGAAGRTKAAELEELMATAREAASRARGQGRELRPGEIDDLVRRQEEIMRSQQVSFTSEEQALRTASNEMAQMKQASDVDAFLATLPEHYQPVRSRVIDAARDRKLVLAEVERDTRAIRRALDQPESLKQISKEVSDAGLTIMPIKRRPGAEGISSVSERVNLTSQGQLVKTFNRPDQARRWLQELEAGAIDPQDIHQLRALAFPRGIVVDLVGGGRVNITNNLTGETVQNIGSLKEAVRVVRQAPNVAATAREIGPRVGGQPPLPGTGGIGGLATEQPPPFCPLLDTE